VLAYNGEIYNGPELRAELEEEGRTFRGHSDTEVIVEAFAAWGVRPTVAVASGWIICLHSSSRGPGDGRTGHPARSPARR